MRKRSKQQYIDAIIEANGLVTQAAKRLGVSHTAVLGMAERHPEVAEALRTAREKMLDVAESKLYQNIEANDNTAIIFYLKTQGKRRGYIERTETVTIDIARLQEMTDEELEEVAARAGLAGRSAGHSD